jgi:hypothetical protein
MEDLYGDSCEEDEEACGEEARCEEDQEGCEEEVATRSPAKKPRSGEAFFMPGSR